MTATKTHVRIRETHFMARHGPLTASRLRSRRGFDRAMGGSWVTVCVSDTKGDLVRTPDKTVAEESSKPFRPRVGVAGVRSICPPERLVGQTCPLCIGAARVDGVGPLLRTIATDDL